MSQLREGILFMALNASLAAIDAVIVRTIGSEIHVFQIVLFRNLISFAIFIPLMLRRGKLPFHSQQMPIHVVRSAMKIASMIALFYAILSLPLAIAMTVSFASPLFASLGAALFLKERMSLIRQGALVAGLCGVVIVLRPDQQSISPGIVFALLSSVGLACGALLMRVSAVREPSSTVVWFNLLLSVPICLLICLPVWRTPSLDLLGLLFVQGAFGAVGQYAYARAMRIVEVSVLVSVDFIKLPLTIVFGAMLFQEPIEPAVVTGAGVILLALLILLGKERRTGR